MSFLAIIGGSGFSGLSSLSVLDTQQIATPYGETSAPVTRGQLGGHEVLFLPRHGSSHQLPPHRINYRANLWALRACGAGKIVALAAVGGITPRFAPAALAVPDQIVDYTHGREHTFYDGTTGDVEHVDVTHPYCEDLRLSVLDACAHAGYAAIGTGTYGATQGPRLETAAEIVRCERDGCDMVGMTGMPEASLARELALCYASLAFVVNWAAGKTGDVISMREIEENLARCSERIVAILTALAYRLSNAAN